MYETLGLFSMIGVNLEQQSEFSEIITSFLRVSGDKIWAINEKRSFIMPISEKQTHPHIFKLPGK